MSREKMVAMIDCMKRLMREQDALAKHNSVSTNFDNTVKRRSNARADAVGCAIEIRRLEHEAHCLAVEMRIADLRLDAYYQDGTAPAGMGRTVIFKKRMPCFPTINDSLTVASESATAEKARKS